MQLQEAQSLAAQAQECAALPGGWSVHFRADESASPIREDVRYDRPNKLALVSFNAAVYDGVADLQADIDDTLQVITGHIDRHEL